MKNMQKYDICDECGHLRLMHFPGLISSVAGVFTCAKCVAEEGQSGPASHRFVLRVYAPESTDDPGSKEMLATAKNDGTMFGPAKTALPALPQADDDKKVGTCNG